MVVGVLSVELLIPENASLKGKRRVLNGLKTRLRNNFNVSVAEVDYLDKWQRTVLGIATVGRDRRILDSVLCRVVDYIRSESQAELIDYQMEMI